MERRSVVCRSFVVRQEPRRYPSLDRMLTTGPYHITRLLRDRPHDGIAFHERYTGDNAMDIQARLRAGCEGDLRWPLICVIVTTFTNTMRSLRTRA